MLCGCCNFFAETDEDVISAAGAVCTGVDEIGEDATKVSFTGVLSSEFWVDACAFGVTFVLRLMAAFVIFFIVFLEIFNFIIPDLFRQYLYIKT